MRWHRFLFVLLLAAPIAQAARLQTTEQVVAIKPDASIVLSSTRNAVFSGIIFPDSVLAQSWLEAHMLQHKLGVSAGDADRYGRTLIITEAQVEMLQSGVAILYASGEDVPGSWHAAEQSARAAKRGVWGDKTFVLTPLNAAQHFGEFHVVEGTITSLYEGKGVTSINFGDDWHTDFSLSIGGRARKAFADIMPRLKPGAKVRVRGSIVEENGPMIRVNTRDALEML